MTLLNRHWPALATLACSAFILAACGHGVLWRLW